MENKMSAVVKGESISSYGTSTAIGLIAATLAIMAFSFVGAIGALFLFTKTILAIIVGFFLFLTAMHFTGIKELKPIRINK